MPVSQGYLPNSRLSGKISPRGALYPSLPILKARKGLKMKVLLIKDVYKLGHAGDIKRVADGYGRNYLIPQRLAVLATPGAQRMAEGIRTKANAHRTVLNEEMAIIAESLKGLTLQFASKAGDTGKLYGSITTEMLAEAIKEKTGNPIDRHQIVAQPIRSLGEHIARVHLTVDLIPEIKVIVFREGEAVPGSETAESEAPKKKASKREPAAEQLAETSPEAAAVEPVSEAVVEEAVKETAEEIVAEVEETPAAETPEGIEKGE
jgi:large subunit ribosomal protein L9